MGYHFILLHPETFSAQLQICHFLNFSLWTYTQYIYRYLDSGRFQSAVLQNLFFLYPNKLKNLRFWVSLCQMICHRGAYQKCPFQTKNSTFKVSLVPYHFHLICCISLSRFACYFTTKRKSRSAVSDSITQQILPASFLFRIS